MQRLQDETGRPGAHVAQAWLDRDDLADILKLYQRLSVVRSVRHKPRSNPAPGGMADPAFRDGFRRLADHGLLLDLQTPWWHLHEAIEMATHAPEVKIVLNHAGLPSDRSSEGLDGWRKAMVDFAALPQAYVKVSGIGIPDRAMFASNFPVDGLCGSFETIFSGFAEATKDKSKNDRERLFRRTAEQVYGLDR